jgi:hypothetical protein
MAISQMKKKAEEERAEDSKMNLVKRKKKQAFDFFKVCRQEIMDDSLNSHKMKEEAGIRLLQGMYTQDHV